MLARLLCTLAVVIYAASASAQTIQLPSFNNVGVNTTVVVPDSGGAYAARDRRASSGYSTFGGLTRNRGWGIRRQAGSIGVTAQFHDLDAIDARLRSVARPKPAAPQPLQIGAGKASDAPLASVAELEQRRLEQAASQAVEVHREVAALMQKGRQARDAGKPGVAAIYFRRALAQATDPLRGPIEIELRALADNKALPGKERSSAGDAIPETSTRTAERDE